MNFLSYKDVIRAIPNALIMRDVVPKILRVDDTDIEEGCCSPLVNIPALEKHVYSVLKAVKRDDKKEILFRVVKPLTKRLFKNSQLDNGLRRKIIEYILSQFAEEDVAVVYNSREKVIIYTRTLEAKYKLEKLDIENYFDTKIFTYKCPICGDLFDQLTDLRFHYVKKHNTMKCPLDSEPIDLHMCKDLKHCAFAFLTFFYFTDPLLSEQLFELYKLAYVCAKYTFNLTEK